MITDLYKKNFTLFEVKINEDREFLTETKYNFRKTIYFIL